MRQPEPVPTRISAIILFEFICVAIIVGALIYNTYGSTKVIKMIEALDLRVSTIEGEQDKMDKFFGILRSGRAESMTNQEILDEVNNEEYH